MFWNVISVVALGSIALFFILALCFRILFSIIPFLFIITALFFAILFLSPFILGLFLLFGISGAFLLCNWYLIGSFVAAALIIAALYCWVSHSGIFKKYSLHGNFFSKQWWICLWNQYKQSGTIEENQENIRLYGNSSLGFNTYRKSIEAHDDIALRYGNFMNLVECKKSLYTYCATYEKHLSVGIKINARFCTFMSSLSITDCDSYFKYCTFNDSIKISCFGKNSCIHTVTFKNCTIKGDIILEHKSIIIKFHGSVRHEGTILYTEE